MGNNILDAVIKTASQLKTLMQQDDLSISVSNTEEILAVFDSKKIPANFKPGTTLKELGQDKAVQEIVRTKKGMTLFMPSHIIGIPFKSIISPILDERNNVVGIFSMSIGLENESKIEATSEDLTSTIAQVNSAVQEISLGAKKLNDMLNSIRDNTKIIEEKLENSNAAIDSIKGISSQSNLLGLNAAIESSRAGTYGKGFSIVANEMRKLATQSNEISKEVSQSLNQMKDTIESVLTVINDVGKISDTQSIATSEVSMAIENISKKSIELVKLSKVQ